MWKSENDQIFQDDKQAYYLQDSNKPIIYKILKDSTSKLKEDLEGGP